MMEPSLLSVIIKDWANKEWPDLFAKVEQSVSARYKEWVQLSIENEWTVIDILHECKTISYRVTPCYVDRNESDDFIWREVDLNPADPEYFEKIRGFVESSLKLTYESMANEKRMMHAPFQTS